MNLTMREWLGWAVVLAFRPFESIERHVPRMCRGPSQQGIDYGQMSAEREWRRNLGVRAARLCRLGIGGV